MNKEMVRADWKEPKVKTARAPFFESLTLRTENGEGNSQEYDLEMNTGNQEMEVLDKNGKVILRSDTLTLRIIGGLEFDGFIQNLSECVNLERHS